MIVMAETMNNKLYKNQQGATLIVALIALLAMTLLTVASKESSTLQSKMTSAYQQKSLSNYAAETALRTAEKELRTSITNTNKLSEFSGGTKGYYSNYSMPGQISTTSPLSTELTDPLDPDLWTDNNSLTVNDYDSSLAFAPRYVIEYIGRDKGTANKVVVDYNDPNASADNKPHIFQITAIGWSRDEGIYTVLQSNFHTGQGSTYFVY